MKTSIVVLGMALLFALTAAAQDMPQMETFLGYTYVRANSATNVPAFSANGGSGQFVYNFNKFFGGVMDLGAVHNGNLSGFHIDNTTVNFLFGPRFSLRYSRLTPYFETLFGGAHIATSTRVDSIASTAVVLPGFRPVFVPIIPGQPITSRLTASQT